MAIERTKFVVLSCILLLATACPDDSDKAKPEQDDAGEAPEDGPDAGQGDEPAADGGKTPEKPGKPDKPTADAGTDKPAADAGSDKPASDAGMDKPAGDAGMDMPAADGGTTSDAGSGSAPGSRYFLPTPEPENTTNPRLEIDKQGGVHAAYPGYAGGDAYYSYCAKDCDDSKSFRVVKLPTDGTAYTAMLALTADGKPRVLLPTFLKVYYYECNGDCTTDAGWQGGVIVEHGGDRDVTGDALALDSQGRPRFIMHTYLAYLGVGQKDPFTYYVQCDSDCTSAASWKVDQIQDQIFQNSTLRFDAQDHAHLATIAVDLTNGTSKNIAYLRCDSDCTNTDSWHGAGLGAPFENPIEEVKPSLSMALTKAGAPRIIALIKQDTGERAVLYFECDHDCSENNWRAIIISKHEKLGSGLDIALDATDHPRVTFTLNSNIGLYYCDAADCTGMDAPWALTKVEFSSDVPPDDIILWPNCTIDAWFLHDPALALGSDGSVAIGYQATDISGGVSTTDPSMPRCVAGKDMTLTRFAHLPSYITKQ